MSIERTDSVQRAPEPGTPMTRKLHAALRRQSGSATDTGRRWVSQCKRVVVIATLIGLLAYELMSLITWLIFVGLAGMAWDFGFSWQRALVAGPILLYPLFILRCWWRVPAQMAKQQHLRALLLGLAPPVLAFGPIAIVNFIQWIGNWQMTLL
jgi:hypothetical protein